MRTSDLFIDFDHIERKQAELLPLSEFNALGEQSKQRLKVLFPDVYRRLQIESLCQRGMPAEMFNGIDDDELDDTYTSIICMERVKEKRKQKRKATEPTMEFEKENKVHGSEQSFDPVDRPKHYASTSVECIDAMIETQGEEAVIDFCVCNAFKYLWRHREKNGDEDVRKANWYLNKAVELIDKAEQRERERYAPSFENFKKVLDKEGIKHDEPT